jgi:hypothetical protein
MSRARDAGRDPAEIRRLLNLGGPQDGSVEGWVEDLVRYAVEDGVAHEYIGPPRLAVLRDARQPLARGPAGERPAHDLVLARRIRREQRLLHRRLRDARPGDERLEALRLDFRHHREVGAERDGVPGRGQRRRDRELRRQMAGSAHEPEQEAHAMTTYQVKPVGRVNRRSRTATTRPSRGTRARPRRGSSSSRTSSRRSTRLAVGDR